MVVNLDEKLVVIVDVLHVIYWVFDCNASISSLIVDKSVLIVPTSVVNPETAVSRVATSADIPATVAPNVAIAVVFAPINANVAESAPPSSPLSPFGPCGPCVPCVPCIPWTKPKFKMGFACVPVKFTVGLEPDDKFDTVPIVKLGVIPGIPWGPSIPWG